LERDPITALDRVRLQRLKALRRLLARLRSHSDLVRVFASFGGELGRMLHTSVEGPASERAPVDAISFEDMRNAELPPPTRVTRTHVIETRLLPSGGVMIAHFERTPEDRAHPLVDEVAGEVEALFGTRESFDERRG
jgi:hypothetical protein